MSSVIPWLSVLSDGFIPFYKMVLWRMITEEFHANCGPDHRDYHVMPWQDVGQGQIDEIRVRVRKGSTISSGCYDLRSTAWKVFA